MTTPDPFGELTETRRRLVMAAALSCAFLAMLDGTVVGTAMPRIVTVLGGSEAWYAWVITAYLLTSTVTVPLYGRFSDLFGRRIPLLAGLGIFLAGSLACGLADSVGALIAFRAIQGVGAGSLLTLGMAVVRDLYPPDRLDIDGHRLRAGLRPVLARGGMLRMQTVLAAVMVAGLVGGPLVGGLLTDHVGWRWTFLLNLPISLVAGAVVAMALPPHRPARAAGKIDIAGVVLLTAGLSLVLLGLSGKGYAVDRQLRPWSSLSVLVPLAVGLALLAALVAVERRAAVPVLPLPLFRGRTFAAIAVAGFFFQVAALPGTLFLPLYFQRELGHSATVSGLLLLPAMLGMVAGNRLTAAVITRTGRARQALAVGAGMVAAGSALFLLLHDRTPVLVPEILLGVVGLGIGPAMGGATIVAQNSVPRSDIGLATATSALTKQIGGVFGLACAQSLLTDRLAAGRVTAGTDAGTAIGTTVAWVGGVGGLLALAAVLVMRDLPVLAPRKQTGEQRTGEQAASRESVPTG